MHKEWDCVSKFASELESEWVSNRQSETRKKRKSLHDDNANKCKLRVLYVKIVYKAVRTSLFCETYCMFVERYTETSRL